MAIPGFGDGLAALPGGGFIDFVADSLTHTTVYTSADGMRWTATGEVTGSDALGIHGPVASNGHVYVAIGSEGGGTAYGMQQNGASRVSSDLRRWTKAPVQVAFGGAGMETLVSTPTGFLATGYEETLGGAAWVSVDGLHWARFTPDPRSATDGFSIAGIERLGTTFVMVGTLGMDSATWTSTDGRHWTLHAGVIPGENEAPEAIVRTPTGLLALVAGPPLETSPDQFESAITPWTSADGIHWRAGSSSPALFGSLVTSLVAAPGGYVAAGSVGLKAGLWTSRDGLDWVAVAGVDLSGATRARVVADGRHVLLLDDWADEPSAFVSAGIVR